MALKRNIKTILFFTATTVLLLVTIGFAGKRNGDKAVRNVMVEILDEKGNYFTDNLEIIDLLNAQSTDYVLGLSINQLNLKVLEQRVEAHPFVKDAQVYHDVRGNLLVKVQQAQPIARVYQPGAEHQYIDVEGQLLPTVTRHTARVPTLELERGFSWEESIAETDYGAKVLALLKYIDADDFWRAQIAGLVISKDGSITLQPQVTRQEVLFGMPEDFDKKFRKLKIFYKDILPNKGWNTYSLVNVKYDHQIICE